MIDFCIKSDYFFLILHPPYWPRRHVEKLSGWRACYFVNECSYAKVLWCTCASICAPVELQVRICFTSNVNAHESVQCHHFSTLCNIVPSAVFAARNGDDPIGSVISILHSLQLTNCTLTYFNKNPGHAPLHRLGCARKCLPRLNLTIFLGSIFMHHADV